MEWNIVQDICGIVIGRRSALYMIIQINAMVLIKIERVEKMA